jgi:hypothetical protein
MINLVHHDRFGCPACFYSLFLAPSLAMQYMVNRNQYNICYYLADGTYLEWSIFVKSISLPISDKDRRFTKEQEGVKKDIERAFGVLQCQFCILKWPARLYDRRQLEQIVLACVILHNMIVEDEKREDAEEDLDLNEAASATIVEELEVSAEECLPFERVEKHTNLHGSSTRLKLKDLVESIFIKKLDLSTKI